MEPAVRVATEVASGWMALETYASEGCGRGGKRRKAGWAGPLVAAPGKRGTEGRERKELGFGPALVFPDFPF